MTGNFNIRDNNWNSLYPFYLIHSNLLVNIVDAFDLSFSHSTNLVPIRYLDNENNSNSIIDLIFLRPNLLEFDNYTILSNLQHSLDQAPLVVNISIAEEFIQDQICTIIKNSEKEVKFTSKLIEAIKKINTSQIIDKDLLELAV